MSFSNALPNGKPSEGLGAFDLTAAAPEFSPLPPGVYRARIVKGEVCKTKAGGDAYRIRFEVIEGDQAGRSVSRLWTFSAKAVAYSKRDLAVFGLTTAAQLLSPFPPTGKEIIVELAVALQRGDTGTEFNDVKSIRVLEVKTSPVAEFLIGEEESQ